METTLTERGQTAVPARIRKAHKMKPGQKLIWIDTGKIIYVVPAVKDPIAALKGAAQGGGLLEALLASRREDKRRDDERLR